MRRRFAAVALLAAAALPIAARAEIEVALSPAVATWHDQVVVTVSGTFSTSCGPHLLSLRAGEPLVQTGAVVALELTAELCGLLAPPSVHPFRVSSELPPLEPGQYQVRVEDSATGDGTATAPLSVHHVSPVQLLVPDAARSDHPVSIQVRSFADCPFVALLGVTDRVVELRYDDSCAIIPPPTSLFVETLELGELPPGEIEVRLYDHGFPLGGRPALATASFRVWDAAGCVPSPTALCLHDGRFRLEVSWRDFEDGTGPGRPIPLPGRDDSGLFWFFHPENVELTAKILDACPLDGHFWVFVSSGSTVEYELTVTDTVAGENVSYGNELGDVPRLIADTAALATCP